jgi:hypothetical protein
MPTFLLSKIRDSPSLKGEVPVFIYQRTTEAQAMKLEDYLYNMKEYSPYLTGNTLRFRRRDQPVNAD